MGICLVRMGRKRTIQIEKIEYRCSVSLHLLDLLVAVGLHACGSGGLGVGSSSQRLGVSLVEHPLEDLLLLGAENLGQALVELRLL